MNKHKRTRYGDEYHCSCGLTWGIDEPDPHKLEVGDSVTYKGRPGEVRACYPSVLESCRSVVGKFTDSKGGNFICKQSEAERNEN